MGYLYQAYTAPRDQSVPPSAPEGRGKSPPVQGRKKREKEAAWAAICKIGAAENTSLRMRYASIVRSIADINFPPFGKLAAVYHMNAPVSTAGEQKFYPRIFRRMHIPVQLSLASAPYL